MKMDESYISTNDAAAVLGITRQRVLQLITRGQLKAEKFANIYMIRKDDLKDVEDRPIGRPPKTATAKASASNGASASKRKGKK